MKSIKNKIKNLDDMCAFKLTSLMASKQFQALNDEYTKQIGKKGIDMQMQSVNINCILFVEMIHL